MRFYTINDSTITETLLYIDSIKIAASYDNSWYMELKGKSLQIWQNNEWKNISTLPEFTKGEIKSFKVKQKASKVKIQSKGFEYIALSSLQILCYHQEGVETVSIPKNC